MEWDLSTLTVFDEARFCLDHYGQLNSWERGFLHNISTKKQLSNKQMDTVRRILLRLIKNPTVMERHQAMLARKTESASQATPPPSK